jgi:hypothetical protein
VQIISRWEASNLWAHARISSHTQGVRLAYYRRTSEMAPNIFDAPLYVGASIEASDVWPTKSESAK